MAASFGALVSCTSHAKPLIEDSSAIPVQVRPPSVVERPDSVTASGSVEGCENAEVAFQVAGKVLRVYVEEGQQVARGQLLAELDGTDYRNVFNAALAQKDAALASASKADAGLRAQELEQARIDFTRAEDEYKRMKFLVDNKSLPPNDFKKFEAAYNTARQRYEMAQEGTRREDRAAAEALARQSDALANEEMKHLSDTRLLAPISGMVGSRKIDAGSTVAAGSPAISLVNLNPAKVRVGVPEAEIDKIKMGEVAEVSIPSLGGRSFKGKVGIIGVAAEPASRTYTVKIIMPNPGPVLLSGMVAEARIFGPAKARALTVPPESIVHDPQGAPGVFVYHPDRRRVYARKVEVGSPVGAEVEIRSGLKGDEQIVVAGQQKLQEGSLVQIAGGTR